MAMRDACKKSVEAAIGRPINAQEARGIEERIRNAMTQLARKDPGSWRSLSDPEKMKEAGKFAAQELIEAAKKATQRVGLTALATQRLDAYRADQVANGSDRNGVDALQRTLTARYDLKNGSMVSAEARSNAIFDNSMREMDQVFEAVNPGLFKRILSGQWSNEPLRRAFADALHGKPSGIKAIDDAAAKYHEVAEALREQFNAAGGIVGRLENWGAPHAWSDRLAIRKGRDAFVNDMMGWVDRSAYYKPDGTRFTDADMRGFLEEAWKTIASNGVTKEMDITGRPAGGAMKANRGSHHRVIHLKPESAYDALKAYSEANMLEAMIGGLRRMSRDTALVETFGPNADHQFNMQLETALREAANADPSQASSLQRKAAYLRNLFDYVGGNNPPPRNRVLADVSGIARSIQVAAKLGGATITSISDYATLHHVAAQNALSNFKIALNSSLAWAPKSRRFARRMGLMIDTLTSEADRYAHDNLTAPDIGRGVANAVIKASGLGFVTNARRLGFSMTMMDAIGHLTRQTAYRDVTKLHANDARVLASKGIDQATWDIWRAAKLDRWGANHTLLTPDAIMAVPGVADDAKREAVIKLLSIVREEQDLAVITPGARERVQMTLGTEAGTVGGELVRSAILFKSFGWTLVNRHMERGLAADNPGGRVAYLASLFLFMTIGGAAANWIKDLLAGRDPREFNPWEDPALALRNWGQAALSGGGLGIYGDFLFAETTAYGGNTLAETLAGPNIGSAGQFASLTLGNAIEALQAQAAGEDIGEATDFGREAVNFIRGHTPFGSLWYTRAITDRAIFNQLQEAVDPGSIERMKRRQETQRGVTYYWDPLSNPARAEGPERPPGRPN